MPTPDSKYSTLANIYTKIRRITRSPSNSQLTDANLNEYINSFVLYDFPEHLRLFDMKQTFSFYTSPNIGEYETNTTNVDDPLYNFNNKYISISNPVYVAGVQVYFTQSREQFFNIYPSSSSISLITNGDGITTNFAGTIQNKPFMRNNVQFTSVDSDGEGLILIDNPGTIPGFPNLGVLTVPNTDAPLCGTVNYDTGVFALDFRDIAGNLVAPGVGKGIYSQVV